MKITNLIEKLKLVKKREGNIEVMITHFDGVEGYQTTCETLFVEDFDFKQSGKETVVKLTL